MIAQRGRVDRAEMERTFNMGVGMVAVVAPEDVDRALAVLTARHIECWTLGSVKKLGKDEAARLVGRPAPQVLKCHNRRQGSTDCFRKLDGVSEYDP